MHVGYEAYIDTSTSLLADLNFIASGKRSFRIKNCCSPYRFSKRPGRSVTNGHYPLITQPG